MDVYCEDVKPTLQPLNLDSGPRMLAAALQRSIVSRGEARPLRGHEGVTVYTCRGESRISTAIANKVQYQSKVWTHLLIFGEVFFFTFIIFYMVDNTFFV